MLQVHEGMTDSQTKSSDVSLPLTINKMNLTYWNSHGPFILVSVRKHNLPRQPEDLA